MICSSCGAEAADDAAFCVKCGSKLVVVATDVPSAKAPPNPPDSTDRFIPNALSGDARWVAWYAIAASVFDWLCAEANDLPGEFLFETGTTVLLSVLWISFWSAARTSRLPCSTWVLRIVIWNLVLGLVSGPWAAFSVAGIDIGSTDTLFLVSAFCYAHLFRSIRKCRDKRLSGLSWSCIVSIAANLLCLTVLDESAGLSFFIGIANIVEARALSRVLSEPKENGI